MSPIAWNNPRCKFVYRTLALPSLCRWRRGYVRAELRGTLVGECLPAAAVRFRGRAVLWGEDAMNKFLANPCRESNAPIRARTPHLNAAGWNARLCVALLAVGALCSGADALAGDFDSLLPTPFVTASTVPSNGDVNPYGVAFVPAGFPPYGTIAAGDLLVSNFNNAQNQQGTGATIVKITPGSSPVAFFQGAPGLGLTTALGVLRAGFVLVGNVPTTDGTFATIKPGSLLVLNRTGSVVAQWTPTTAGIDGPWDLTIADGGSYAKVFVSNVLNGTVVRLDVNIDAGGVHLMRSTRIASGYPFRGDAAALVVGPTGLAYDAVRDVLYVASTADNAIFAVFGAGATSFDGGKGALIYADNKHLHGPLALAFGPNGHLFTANGDAVNNAPKHPSEITEFTREGRFVAQLSMDPAQGGAFGLAFSSMHDRHVRFAAVDDNVPNITIWDLRMEEGPR